MDLKKIRHEVVKFGMSGFDPTKKEEARIALAVSLGAKPPKKEYLNYKELMQKRKEEKIKETEEKQQMRSKSVLQTGGKKKKKGNNDVGHFLSSYGKNPESNFTFVKFEAHKAKKKQAADGSENCENQHSSKDHKNMDLKKIRHEVVKFGMSGFDPTKKEEARIALAVSLGAKPPKKEYLNYKELMQKRKEEKIKETEEKQQMRSKSVLQTGGKKKKKGNNDVGHFLSSYGKVNKKDLNKKDDKSSKKKKKKSKII